MAHNSDVAFTPAVKAAQEERGSRAGYERVAERGAWNDHVTDDLEAFLAEVDSFYLGTASADGQPYIQHRGGPKGFLRVLDRRTLAFADFGGNRQYISVGNMDENEQAFLFLMDYKNRRRIKLWGRARYVEGDAKLVALVEDESYDARVERVILFAMEVWDINCPQHIRARPA